MIFFYYINGSLSWRFHTNSSFFIFMSCVRFGNLAACITTKVRTQFNLPSLPKQPRSIFFITWIKWHIKSGDFWSNRRKWNGGEIKRWKERREGQTKSEQEMNKTRKNERQGEQSLLLDSAKIFRFTRIQATVVHH